MDASSLALFMAKWDGVLGNLVEWVASLAWQGVGSGWSLRSLKTTHSHSVILCFSQLCASIVPWHCGGPLAQLQDITATGHSHYWYCYHYCYWLLSSSSAQWWMLQRAVLSLLLWSRLASGPPEIKVFQGSMFSLLSLNLCRQPGFPSKRSLLPFWRHGSKE